MIGQTISHYRVVRQLGGGAMGIVYEAEDLRLGRRVALKFLPERLCEDPGALERFQREARATSLLNHPNICTIFDIEEDAGRPFIVMELLEGHSLKDRLAAAKAEGDSTARAEPLQVGQLLEIAVQVADGLDAAHAHGVIHRDIKPANIFLTRRSQVKILDFGIAKLAPSCRLVVQPAISLPGPPEDAKTERSGDAVWRATGESPPLAQAPDAATAVTEQTSMTATGAVPGTTAYMSPEQVRGEELDPRSDLFSFGVVLYEMATGEKPFAASTPMLTMAAIVDERPVSPLLLNPGLPPALEAIIAKSLEKNRELRYESAADLRTDLKRLRRELEPDRSSMEAIAARPHRVFRRPSFAHRWIPIGMAGVLLTLVVVLSLWYLKQRRLAATPARNSVAVLPLQDMSADKGDDFLRVAIADEITNILTYTHSLEVRPVSSSAKYAEGPPDPQKAGRELHVADLVTGHYLREGDRLVVTLEAVDVKRDRLLWRGTVTAPAGDLLAMQKELATQVRQRLVPVLGGAAHETTESATRPSNAEGYDLYLRSSAIPHDPEPNRQAIAMLERSVALDPGYAPAWDVLGLRYYYDATYSTGGARMSDRALAAYERALVLDPNYIAAAAHLVRYRVERGDLVAGYEQAKALLARRPNNSQAHFTLSYVLRYAGLLTEAAKECDTALQLDPGYYGLRSCAIVFAELGDGSRALDFLNLDAGSDFSTNLIPAVLLRQGDIAQARQAAAKMMNDRTWFGGLLQTCLQPGSAENLDRLDAEVQAAEPALLAQRDPEFRYLQGSLLAFCGERKMAVKLLHSSIAQNYCATEALKDDPLLGKLRPYPEFDDLRAAAQRCQQAFRAGRQAAP